MKTSISYSLIAAAMACGFANAQTTAYTTPVGYETLAVAAGVNFLGVRLQQPVVAAGTVSSITATTLTVSGSLDLGVLLNDSTTYILEVVNANGVTQEFIGSAATGSVITTPTDLSAIVTVGNSYKIRSAPTLATTFGANNEAGLETGFFGPGGDIVLLPNPSAPGGFDQYYYDGGLSSWADGDGNAVTGSSIAWNYADGVLISATGSGLAALTISGEVKTAKTNYNLTASSINFLSSVSPAGATLASAFDGSLASIDQGFFGPGGDIFLIPNPSASGGFDQYYYDGGLTSWADASGNPVDGSAISLSSGILISNDGGVADVVNTPPTSYNSL